MPADEFLESLKADWDRQALDATLLQLRCRRWVPHAWLAADIIGAVVMAAFGLGFAVVAATSKDLLFALSAGALLAVGLPMVVASVRTRLRSLKWNDQTPEGVLKSTLARLAATRRILKLGRGSAYCLFALVVAVWACALFGSIRQPGRSC